MVSSFLYAFGLIRDAGCLWRHRSPAMGAMEEIAPRQRGGLCSRNRDHERSGVRRIIPVSPRDPETLPRIARPGAGIRGTLHERRPCGGIRSVFCHPVAQTGVRATPLVSHGGAHSRPPIPEARGAVPGPRSRRHGRTACAYSRGAGMHSGQEMARIIPPPGEKLHAASYTLASK